MHARRRTHQAVAAVLVACAPAGCSGGAPAPATSAATSSPLADGLAGVADQQDAGITGVLLQFRRDVARRRVEVRLTASNGGLLVDGLALSGSGLSAEPGDPRGAELRPGNALDVPVVVGGDCAAPSGPATAVVLLGDATGAQREVSVPLADDGLVARLHDGDCFAQELLRQVAVEVVDVVETAGPALQVTVRLRRVGGTDRVRITRLDSNTVYDITTVGRLPALTGQGAVTGVLRLVPARCDVHALGESYRTSLIGLAVALGDREPHSFVLTAEPAVRQRIEAFAVEACRAGGN